MDWIWKWRNGNSGLYAMPMIIHSFLIVFNGVHEIASLSFSIYCKTKQEARKIGNSIFLFLRDKLKLPINREKSGIRRPLDFKILGYGFVPTYRKGEKGKYQLVVQEKRWESFKAKLKELTRKLRRSRSHEHL